MPAGAKGQFEPQYWQIEMALAGTFRIAESVRATTFRHWIGSLQKSGVLGEAARVGKGVTLRYRPDMYRRLLIALALAELGCPPAIILALIEKHWKKRLVPIFEAAEGVLMREDGEKPGPHDVVLLFVGAKFRSGSLMDAAPLSDIQSCTVGDLAKVMTALQGAEGNVLAVNLSALARRFHDALIVSWKMAKEPQEQPAAVRKLRAR
jgi:hypothetical protein